MLRYPLFFTYRDRIYGNGFLAEVASRGRILATTEEGEYWVYGVEPGGLAATGATPKEALEAFREAFTSILVDLSAEAGSFDAFVTAVQGFFHEVNAPVAGDWQQAVQEVRAGQLQLPDTPLQKAETAASVEVTLAQQVMFSPKDNQRPQIEQALAA